MFRSIRKRYLRFLLPAVLLLLLLAFLLFWISGFGILTLRQEPVELSQLSPERVEGSYATVEVEELDVTFGFFGYEDPATGEVTVEERYCVYPMEGKYLIILAPGEYVSQLEMKDDAAELIASGEVGSVMELDYGSFTGTVDTKPEKKVVEILKNWIVEHHISESKLTDRFTEADLSGYEGAAEGDYSAYLEDVILPVQLKVGHVGRMSFSTVRQLTAAAALLALLALLLLASIFAGLWERPLRSALRLHGKENLSGDFVKTDPFGRKLRVGNAYLWLFGPLFTRIVPTADVIWAYARSKRLEGGKLSWSLVLKTVDDREYAVRLGDSALVQSAITAIQAKGHPLVLGFDKEKQKLYQKDLNAFRARAKNGTL